MKNTKFIYGFTRFGLYGFLAPRLVWQTPEKAPNVEAQHEFKDIADLVHALETEGQRVGEQKKQKVVELVNKMKDKPEFFSPELLTALAKRPERNIRIMVAMNKKTPKTVLAELSHDKDERVRFEAKQPRQHAKGRAAIGFRIYRFRKDHPLD